MTVDRILYLELRELENKGIVQRICHAGGQGAASKYNEQLTESRLKHLTQLCPQWRGQPSLVGTEPRQRGGP